MRIEEQKKFKEQRSLMEKKGQNRGTREKNVEEYYVVDLLHVVKFVWKRAWVVLLAGILIGALCYGYAAYGIVPTYSSSIKLYVNNSSISSVADAAFSISSSQLTAAQGLVRTYSEILNSRMTLIRVQEKAEVNYSWSQLSGMINCTSANNTEIMRVTVTCTDPYEASKIANTIADVLPERISEIIDGATMEVVDAAVPSLKKVAPSVTKYTALGLLVGVMLAVVVLVVLALLDDTIHDEEYILRTYDYPILGKVPDLLNVSGKSYGYYSQKNSSKERAG
jgi:capsular polysaccharide biosynthesis protein